VNRRGFTLPLALVILVAVSMMVATSVHVSLSDFHSNRGGRLAARALFAAEAGSQHTIARWESGPYGSLVPGDSVSSGWTTLPDGSRYRSVVTRLDDGSDDSPLYRVTTEGRPSRTSTARRQVTTVLTGGASTPDLLRRRDHRCRPAASRRGAGRVRGRRRGSGRGPAFARGGRGGAPEHRRSRPRACRLGGLLPFHAGSGRGHSSLQVTECQCTAPTPSWSGTRTSPSTPL
jgi:hypothetical protein